MAKIKHNIFGISGKLGKQVFVESNAYGSYVRNVAKGGFQNTGGAFKQQQSRTRFLNSFAGELNTIIATYAGKFKSKDFYQRVQKCFRMQPEDNRLLLLLQLKGLQVNNKYPLHINPWNLVRVTDNKTDIGIHLAISGHPRIGQSRANCYAHELLLVTWAESGHPPMHASQFTDWIGFTDKSKEFEFTFPKAAGTIHWLLFLGQRMGIDEMEIDSMRATGMKVYNAGTLNPEEAELIARIEQERNAQHSTTGTKWPPVRVRIKAKESEAPGNE
jgi:hypothetical protein